MKSKVDEAFEIAMACYGWGPMDDPEVKKHTDAIRAYVDQAYQKRSDLIEAFIVTYLKQTGLGIDDVTLCESNSGDGMRWWIEPKSVSESRPIAPIPSED